MTRPETRTVNIKTALLAIAAAAALLGAAVIGVPSTAHKAGEALVFQPRGH